MRTLVLSSSATRSCQLHDGVSRAQMALLCRRWTAQVALAARSVHAHRLSDNLSLLTACPVPARRESQPLDIAERPLAVMLPWLGATSKGISKYANFYLSQGFNVLVGTLTPRQLLLPENGSQVCGELSLAH